MELYSAEVAKTKALIAEWWAHPETELEATFGLRGQVDIQTFLAVAERLRGRGLEEVTQQDKLNICLPDHVRFTLIGFGAIQQYCKDDILSGKPFEAMIKDRSSAAESNLDIEDYNLRIKSRRETPMAANDARVNDILGIWPSQKKAFRLIKRWTFRGKGVRYDLSMVRSTPRDSKNDFKWVRKFKDNALLNSLPIYEIEVELERTEFKDAEDAYKGFMRGIGEVMRGIQKNSLLIRKSKSQSVLEEYAAVVGTTTFRGVSPKTLEYKNMTSTIEDKIPNIRQGYNVTDKADGLRVHAFCGADGELYLIDMSMTVYKTGLSNPACAKSLLDGEWVTRDNDNKQIYLLLLFDIYLAEGKEDVTKSPFAGGRHTKMTEWTAKFNGEGMKKSPGAQLLVSYKTFLFGKDGDKSIFLNAGRIRDTARIYPTDGLIFSSNNAPIPERPSATFDYQFKWKPSEDNTIDFLVTIEKDPDLQSQDRLINGIHPISGDLRPYKILRLYVGSSTDPAYDDPRATILYNQPLPTGQDFSRSKTNDYKPILFNPKDYPDTMANVCYREVLENKDTGDFYSVTERTIEPIRDKAIIECRYDSSQPPGWRWIPIRVRNDKTERLLKAMATKKIKKGDSVYARTLNSEKVAESVWNSIHEPITESMIRTGSDQPTDKEASDLVTDKTAVSKKYYDRKAPKEDLMKVRGMIDFHNKYVKDKVLYQKVFMKGPGLTVIDVAVGKAGDLHRWIRGKAAFVLGIDAAGENIRDSKNGAYNRYMGSIVESGSRDNIPTCVFVIGESQGNYQSGEAGATPEEQDILRSVFGKVKPSGAVPPYIGQYAAGRLSNGVDIITCQFAVHYFFKDEEMFNGLLRNIKENLKVGGYFIGTTFDGEKVFQMLRGLPEGGHRSGTDNTSVLWTITKRYALDEIPSGNAGFGIPIDVDFISIGTSQTEYLVPFGLLVDKLKSIGLELLDDEELKKLGLSTSTALFDATYEIAKKSGAKYDMNDGIKQFSFLNRWFIFKRVSDGPGLDEEGEALVDEKKMINEVVTVVKEDAEPLAEVPGSAVIEAEREVPVDVTSVPSMLTKTYSSNEIFQFYMDAALQDKLKLGDKSAGRWLSPGAPFPIPNVDNPADIYPSVEHYISAMRLILGSNKPELGPALYGTQGDIHQKYLRERLELTEGGTKALSEDKDNELIKKEINDVRDSQRPSALKKYGAIVDEAKFTASKNKVIRDALRVRLEKDARFRRIVEAVRDQGKILLYYTGTSPASELGGYRGADEKIHGENKIGRFIMELAGGFKV
jgi:predicted NAD-dependent protein-ADP-ribosyltransferase YbiA (DUF1768 family)